MNRFFSRTISLILAVAFLLSAAGISYGVLFQSMRVYAADSQHGNLTEQEIAFNPVISSGISVGDTIKEIRLTIKDPGLTLAQYNDNKKNFSVELAGKSFVDATNSTQKVDISFGSGDTLQDGKGVSYFISLKNVLYQGPDKQVKLYVNYHISGISSFDIVSKEFAVKGSDGSSDQTDSDGSCVVQSVKFQKGGEYLRSVTRGTGAFDLVITVLDKRLSGIPVADGCYAAIDSAVFTTSADPKFEFKTNSSKAVYYTITFSNVKYTGSGRTVDISISYPDDWGLPLTNLSYKSNELREDSASSSRWWDDDDDDSSSSHPDIAPPTPTLIVSQYDFGSGSVTAASSFQLRLKVTNTSKRTPVDNIVMKVTVPEALTMTNSSNTFYIEQMPKQSSVERTLNLSVKPNAEPISHPIKISFTYEAVIDEVRKQYTSEEEISIPVTQLNRFLLNPVEAPEEIIIGESGSIEAKFINKGKTTVYNVTAEISGNITQPGQRQFIGNLDGGKEETADFLLSADTPGEVSGEVIITYEDANMNVTELREPFRTNAISYEMPMDDQAMMNPTEMPATEPAWYAATPIWTWALGGVVAIIVLSFLVKVVRQQREKKLLEEDDEDF